MRNVVTGQVFLIVCFVFYLIWWYRGFQPNTHVNRLGGPNGVFLSLSVAFGIAGVAFSLMCGEPGPLIIKPPIIFFTGVAVYVMLVLVTVFLFHRVLTTELLLIVAWTTLEVHVNNLLEAGGILSIANFWTMFGILGLTFIISTILYVAYYNMEPKKGFYAAMVPLIAAECSMIAMLGMGLR